VRQGNAAPFCALPRTRVHALWQIVRAVIGASRKDCRESPAAVLLPLCYAVTFTPRPARRSRLAGRGGTGSVELLFVGKHSYNLALAIGTPDRIGAGRSRNHAERTARLAFSIRLWRISMLQFRAGLTVFLGNVRWTGYRISVIKLKSANETSVFRHVGRASKPRRTSSADQGAS
jgi:hypothetical protein